MLFSQIYGIYSKILLLSLEKKEKEKQTTEMNIECAPPGDDPGTTDGTK